MFYTVRPIAPRRNRSSKTWRKDVLLLDRETGAGKHGETYKTGRLGRERDVCILPD